MTVLPACGTKSFNSVGDRWGNHLAGLEGCIMRSSFFRRTPVLHASLQPIPTWLVTYRKMFMPTDTDNVLSCSMGLDYRLRSTNHLLFPLAVGKINMLLKVHCKEHIYRSLSFFCGLGRGGYAGIL
jgi:hypothetical protein